MIKAASILFLLCSVIAVASEEKPAPPMKNQEEKLVITCMPSLVSVLWSKEEKKGLPLTKEEVLAIRDAASAVALPASKVAAIEKARGYKDIEPDHAWDQWQIARVDLLKHKKGEPISHSERP